jgi:predicted nucleic acid-binding protein
MIRTFVDSGVLVSAARGTDVCSEKALEILEDEDRQFASSAFVRLEILPKAVCYGKTVEAQFYQAFFDSVEYWAENVEKLVQDAYQIACDFGLAALDALHIAAALSVGAEEFVTTERETKPMYRVTGIQITSVLDD